MASEESVIRVNFGRPVPLLPTASVVLLPHAIIPLDIRDERRRRMVDDVLESSGQVALAMFASRVEDGEESDAADTTPVRSGVCLGRIVDYQRAADGQFYIALQGVCRARIRYELPRTAETPYRMAMLEPVGLEEVDETRLTATRMRLTELLESEPLSELREAPAFLRHMKDTAIPTSVLLELLATVFISDSEVRYKLLEGEHARTRSRLIERELNSLARLIRLAAPQRRVVWPKGCSWN
jgi:Lon protease-like protein